MKNTNPFVIGAAAGTGVLVSNLFTGNGSIQTALLAGGICGALVTAILYWRGKRQG